MSIRIACPSCRGTLEVPERMAGQRLRCPSCQVMLHIPAAVVTCVADGFRQGKAERTVKELAEIFTTARK